MTPVEDARFAETLNFYISDSRDGLCRVPRQKLVEVQAALRSLSAENARLRERLAEAERIVEPFATFASMPSFDRLPSHMQITQGSSMACRQVTVGDFRAARTWKEQGDV